MSCHNTDLDEVVCGVGYNVATYEAVFLIVWSFSSRISAGMSVFQALLFAKHLPHFCCLLSGYKFCIMAIDFWVVIT